MWRHGPDQEAEGAEPVTEVDEQVAGLLGSPRAIRVRGHAQDVHSPGPHLQDEQHIQAAEEDRVHLEEIAGQPAIGLSTQERRQEVSTPRGAGQRRRARGIRRTVASLIW